MACTNSSAGKCVQHRQAGLPPRTAKDLSQMDKPDVIIKSCSAAEWLLRVARLGANRRPPTRPKEVGAGPLAGAASKIKRQTGPQRQQPCSRAHFLVTRAACHFGSAVLAFPFFIEC